MNNNYILYLELEAAISKQISDAAFNVNHRSLDDKKTMSLLPPCIVLAAFNSIARKQGARFDLNSFKNYKMVRLANAFSIALQKENLLITHVGISRDTRPNLSLIHI